MRDIIRLIEAAEQVTTESAPPGKKAERFIKKHKKQFKQKYGKNWGSYLYGTAWKQFGEQATFNDYLALVEVEAVQEIAPSPDIVKRMRSRGVLGSEKTWTPEEWEAELKDRFANAAEHGWSKPEKGTPSRDHLDRFMADDPAFRQRIADTRPDWLTGEGDAHVGALYHGNWTNR